MRMVFSCYAICGAGVFRAENQDNLYIDGVFRHDVSDNSVFRYEKRQQDAGLFAVADGMGGESYGELASLAAVQSLGNAEASAEGMVRYLIEINNNICDLMEEKGGVRIGSTFAGLHVEGNSAGIVNIGDSRIYLFRSMELVQLSCDHTLAQQMVNMGIIDKAAADKHHGRHKLTQHLGVFPSEFIIEPHTAHFEVRPDDVFLICSDGLTDMLDDTMIKTLLEEPTSIADRAEALYGAALRNVGKDNITLILLEAVV